MHCATSSSALARPRRVLYAEALVLLALLGGCVSETRGGFNVKVSEQQAVADYVKLALAHYGEGDLQAARHSIDKAAQIDHRQPGIYDVQAMILQREGEFDLATKNFQRAISLDKDSSRARNNYAAFLYSQEQYTLAYEQLSWVVRDTDYPGRAIAFENLGRAALRLEREEEATRAFYRALQLDPGLYVAALELAVIHGNHEQWQPAWQFMRSYLDSARRRGVAHTPRALLAGIQIAEKTGNQQIVEDFSLILTTLYQQSPEYADYAGLSDAH